MIHPRAFTETGRVEVRKHGVGLGVDLIRVVDPRRQVGEQVLDDLGLHLRLRRGFLAPVVDLQFAAGELFFPATPWLPS